LQARSLHIIKMNGLEFSVTWESLVSLWSAYNDHLSHVIGCIPEDAATCPCQIGKENPVSLDFVIKDYLRHLRLHLQDILDEQA